MEQANETFIKLARQKDLKRASLLRILIYDNQTLKEESLLDYQIETYSLGALMLENYKIDGVITDQHPYEFMHASWTIPIDFRDNRWVVATAYYMSNVVRQFWEDRLDGRITWYVSTLNQIETVLEELASQLEEQETGEDSEKKE